MLPGRVEKSCWPAPLSIMPGGKEARAATRRSVGARASARPCGVLLTEPRTAPPCSPALHSSLSLCLRPPVVSRVSAVEAGPSAAALLTRFPHARPPLSRSSVRRPSPYRVTRHSTSRRSTHDLVRRFGPALAILAPERLERGQRARVRRGCRAGGAGRGSFTRVRVRRCVLTTIFTSSLRSLG